jgi:excisionase family DNA binding protein
MEALELRIPIFYYNGRFMQDEARNQPATPGERWLSVEEITGHLGVARDTVYRWIEQKGLPAHRLGKLWKFKVSEVDEWVRSGGADDKPSGKPASRKTSGRRS